MKTKKQIQKGCKKIVIWCNIKYKCGMFEDLKHSDHIILCPTCQAQLQTTQDIYDEIERRLKSIEHYEGKGTYAYEVLKELKSRING